MTEEQRSDYYFRKEQGVRLLIRRRKEVLYEKARRQVDLRIKFYPQRLRKHYAVIVAQMFRSMCEEDPTHKALIENQQLYLRLAHAYKMRGDV